MHQDNLCTEGCNNSTQAIVSPQATSPFLMVVDLCMLQAKEYYRCLLHLLSADWLLQQESSRVIYPPEVLMGYHCGYCPAGFQGGWGPLLLGLTPLPAWTRSWMPDAALPLCSNITVSITKKAIRLAESSHGQSQRCHAAALSPPAFNRYA